MRRRKKKTLIFSWMSDKSLSMLAELRGQVHHTNRTLLISVLYSNMPPPPVISYHTFCIRTMLDSTSDCSHHSWADKSNLLGRHMAQLTGTENKQGQRMSYLTETLSPLCTEHGAGGTATEDNGRGERLKHGRLSDGRSRDPSGGLEREARSRLVNCRTF